MEDEDIFTGKNEKEFNEWFIENYEKYIITGKRENKFFYPMFDQLPFAAQSGIVKHYLDEKGYFIETFRHHQGMISYKVNNSPYYEYSDTRLEALRKAFIVLNDTINKKEDEHTTKK